VPLNECNGGQQTVSATLLIPLNGPAAQMQIVTTDVATALNSAIGYDRATVIVRKATESGRPLREVALAEGVGAELYDRTIDLARIALGNQAK
jgi:fumarate hydratase class II